MPPRKSRSQTAYHLYFRYALQLCHIVSHVPVHSLSCYRNIFLP
jgi:hypothetical protein